jgi:NAD-specific glutamate dehydrogenase
VNEQEKQLQLEQVRTAELEKQQLWEQKEKEVQGELKKQLREAEVKVQEQEKRERDRELNQDRESVYEERLQQFTGKPLEHWSADGIAALLHELNQPDLAKSAEFNRWDGGTVAECCLQTDGTVSVDDLYTALGVVPSMAQKLALKSTLRRLITPPDWTNTNGPRKNC